MSTARASRRRGLGLVVVATSLGFVLVQLNVSILNVALARIGAALGTGVAGLQWVVDAYTIAFASLMLSAGALGDRIGARRAYLSGLVLFVVASLGCGLAPGIGTLIAVRAIQGIGASLLVPCSLALLTHACHGDATTRARAISLWTAAASVSLAAGPVIGGVLIDTFGWRSIFLINLPIGAAGLWLTQAFVEDTPQHHSGFDWMGQTLALVTLLVLTGTVIEAGAFGIGSAIGTVRVRCRCRRRYLLRGRGSAQKRPNAAAAILSGAVVQYCDGNRCAGQSHALRRDFRAGPLPAAGSSLLADG